MRFGGGRRRGMFYVEVGMVVVMLKKKGKVDDGSGYVEGD